MGDSVTEPPHETLTECFERLCPYSISLGMTWDQYWHGDPMMVKAYRKAEKLRMERMNYEHWLQGLYVYDALTKVSPLFRDLGKRSSEPYPEEPYDIFGEKPKEEEMTDQEKLDQSVNHFLGMVAIINKRFAKGGAKEDA